MEPEALQRRSAATIRNMGVNTYSQIVSAFRAQGDLTDEKLTILPVLQNALGISRERHTAEVKRALYDEQLASIASGLDPASTVTNWESQANYSCPTIVHRPPNTEYIQLAEQILQSTPPITIIQHPPVSTTAKLNHDLKQLVNDEVKSDGIRNAIHPQPSNSSTKQILNQFSTTDMNGTNVVRLVRAKQPVKRKSSLDTLIEVVQKELLRVNEQANSKSPSPSPPRLTHVRSLPNSRQLNRTGSHRSVMQSVLPSSHPASLTSQSVHSLKITRKDLSHNTGHFKRSLSYRQRHRSLNAHDDADPMDHDGIEQRSWNDFVDDGHSESETIEDVVRDTVDRLVAITLLNTAPFVVNMLTAVPGSATNTDSKMSTNSFGTHNPSTLKFHPIGSSPPSVMGKSDHTRPELILFSSKLNEARTSNQHTSPMKTQQQQHLHHPQLIIQPTTSAASSTSLSGTGTSTLFVAPRIINFQTVVPKPTTNIQIGNTKIILVSPSNITQHLPHSTVTSSSSMQSHHQQSQQSGLGNHSPVKLVKFTTTNNTNSMSARSNPITINSTQAATLGLPKNVQIVIPSQTSANMQLARAHNDDPTKFLSSTITTSSTASFRPVTLTTCSVDQIPQAAQEVTVSTSPTPSPPSTNTAADRPPSASLPTTTESLGASSIGQPQHQFFSNVMKTRTSPLPDEMHKSTFVNTHVPPFTHVPRPASAHGPMIYRMTSVNPNVPVFRVRTATAPSSTTVMTKSLKTDTKPMAVPATTNMCYEPKQPHPTSTTNGSVSVLACFKTTKKRNKERAIMPRPSTIDSLDTSHEIQPRSNASSSSTSSMMNTTMPLASASDHLNSKLSHLASADYPQISPIRLLPQLSLPATLTDDTASNLLSSTAIQEHINDTTTSSSNSIPIARHYSSQSDDCFTSVNTASSPAPRNDSSPTSPIRPWPTLQTSVEDKPTPSVDNIVVDAEPDKQLVVDPVPRKRKERSDEDASSPPERSWTATANSLLRDILSEPEFGLLDVTCQQDLQSKVELIQTNLLNGVISTIDEFHQSVLDMKQQLIESGSAEASEERLKELFNHFDTACHDLRNERKRARRSPSMD